MEQSYIGRERHTLNITFLVTFEKFCGFSMQHRSQRHSIFQYEGE